MPVPTSNYTEYLACAAEAAVTPPDQWNFKSDPRYQRILEHVRIDQALQFIELASTEFAGRWPAIAEIVVTCAAANDALGQSSRAPIASLMTMASPSNFRYMWHALLILKQLEDMGGWRGHIIEMGGGYGGLALFVNRLAHLFPTVEIDSYSIVDLAEPGALQGAFTRELGLSVGIYDGLDEAALSDLVASTGERFFFSAYAFSEFHQAMRDWYEPRLMRHMPHGLIVWNFAEGVGGFEALLGGPVYQFVDAPLSVEPERPEVDRGLGNLFVRW